jgi:transcriptional regulator with XRE-family HTH domain
MQNTTQPPKFLSTFGKRLKLARIDRGLTQTELRAQMERHGISIGETYISELERTDKAPSLPVAAAMAKVLGVSLDYLGLITDEPQIQPRLEQPAYA